MIRWLVSNLSSMVLALALAVLVWVAAVNEENPIEQRVFPQVIPALVVGRTDSMLLSGPTPGSATVTIRAPRLTWSTLTADQIQVVADITGLPAGSYDLRLNVTVSAQLATVVRVSPSQVRVEIQESGSRLVPVRLTTTGEAAVGFRIGEPSLSVTEAEVSGPASLVNQVSELRAEMRIAGARGGLQDELALVPVDASGGIVSGVEVNPPIVEVSLPVEQLGGFRDVAVRVLLDGQVAPGYRVTNVSVTPLVVTLFGSNPTAVANLPGFVDTESLSIEGASDDVEARLVLQLPEGVSLVGVQTVLVQVSIAAIEDSRTVTRTLEISGLGPGLIAEAAPPSVDVILSGPLLTLDSLQPEAVRVILDVAGLARGAHQVEPTVVVLAEEVIAQTILPPTVEVVIRSGVPTPTSPPVTPTAEP